MVNSRELILDKTNYGINIYAHILRKYYPGTTVLSLSGKDCQPTMNPFNADKPTLKVTIKDNCARHTDTENAIPDGDVFDFAKLYYQLEESDLLEILAKELNIVRKESETDTVVNLGILKAPRFSYFKHPIRNIVPFEKFTLFDVYQVIVGKAFKKNTKALREISDPKQARNFKANNFDYVTFSGIFSKRKDTELIQHSGLLTIDFDHIPNLQKLKNQLLKDEYFETELMFVSPSGDGLKWIISIDLSQASHADNFQAVANYIKYTYKIEVDKSGKDISRACFLPHDPDAYIKPNYFNSCKSNKTRDYECK